jgi:hypothetical protein
MRIGLGEARIFGTKGKRSVENLLLALRNFEKVNTNKICKAISTIRIRNYVDEYAEDLGGQDPTLFSAEFRASRLERR